jgi:hypothetical protein
MSMQAQMHFGMKPIFFNFPFKNESNGNNDSFTNVIQRLKIRITSM